MIVLKDIKIDAAQIVKEHGLDEYGPVQRFIDNEVLRLAAPYAPRDNELLIKSGIKNTIAGSGLVVYNTPYARRWYYEPAKFQGAPTRGNYWVERMLNEGGKVKILQGAAKIAGGKAKF